MSHIDALRPPQCDANGLQAMQGLAQVLHRPSSQAGRLGPTIDLVLARLRMERSASPSRDHFDSRGSPRHGHRSHASGTALAEGTLAARALGGVAARQLGPV